MISENGLVVSAVGGAVSRCLSEARRVAGLRLKDTREVLRSGGEDGLYRVTLADGTVVECTVQQRACSSAEVLCA